VASTETTPVVELKLWPRWAWFVFPTLAIVIGGGLGFAVTIAEPESSAQAAQPLHLAAKPIAEVPAPPTPSPAPVAADPPLEIEVEPDPPKPGAANVPRPTPRPKHRPKPTKSTPCNVYEHMDGCSSR
jgi:outer membrane biosynthesis protein TonB